MLVAAGPGPNAAEAMHYWPFQEIPPDELADEDRRAEANAYPQIQLHRVCVWHEGPSEPVIGALLRHELEHARQWDALGRHLGGLYDLATDLLDLKAGGLDGCKGMHVNTIPAERDCDAAAAMFLREHHSDAVADVCRSEHRKLACSLVGAQPLGTLVARMVAWMFINRDLCEARIAAGGYPFGSVLDAYAPGSGAREFWEALDRSSERPD
jgi:hypothetical protein